MQELLSLDTARVTEHAEDSNRLKHLVEDTISVGGTAAVILSAANPESTEVYSLFCSYITAMWTTFETLAGDLWEAALNEKPDVLAQLKGKSNRLRKSKPSLFDYRPSQLSENSEGKSIRLDQVQYFHWDLTKKMGSLLRSKFEFARLEGIREAYASAFCEQYTEIAALLTDESIDNLSVMRNAIVHKGAKADKEYIRRQKALKDLPAAEDGKTIPIDGEIASRMIGETIYCSVKLIAAVDDWLAAH